MSNRRRKTPRPSSTATSSRGCTRWVAWIFDRPVAKNRWWHAVDEKDWLNVPNAIIVDHIGELFETSLHSLASYSDSQIAQGLEFIVGHGSEYMFLLADDRIAWPRRERCVRSCSGLYRDLFARRCSSHLSHRDERGAHPLNGICYMLWDMIPIGPEPTLGHRSRLDSVLLDVMIGALQLCSDPCRESALHGLGHWQLGYPEEVEAAIDSFLHTSKRLRPELRHYAENAKRGCVQ